VDCLLDTYSYVFYLNRKNWSWCWRCNVFENFYGNLGFINNWIRMKCLTQFALILLWMLPWSRAQQSYDPHSE